MNPEAIEAAAKALRGYTGDCICHEAYTGRNLIDPDCRHCDMLGVHEAILEAAAPFLIREARADELDAAAAGFSAEWLWERADAIRAEQ